MARPTAEEKAAAADPAQFLPSEVRWSVQISAPPSGPPVIAQDIVVVPLQSALAVAHRAIDGVEAWRVDLSPEQPLAADGSKVYFAAGEAVHALNAANGTVAWRRPIGRATAPLLAEQGWVIVPTDGKLSALRADDGSLVWTRDTGPQSERASLEGDRLYVPLTDGRVLALELKTGATRWQRTLGGAPSEILPLADRVYLGSADKYFYALDASTGRVDWRFNVRAPMRGRPVLAGQVVIVAADNNELRAFDWEDGALRWRQGLAFRPTGGPVLIGPAVLAPGTTSELRAFDTAKRGEAGRIPFNQPLAAPFAAAQLNGAPVIAALTGSLTEQWNLTLMQTPTQLPQLSVEPDLGVGAWRAGFDAITLPLTVTER